MLRILRATEIAHELRHRTCSIAVSFSPHRACRLRSDRSSLSTTSAPDKSKGKPKIRVVRGDRDSMNEPAVGVCAAYCVSNPVSLVRVAERFRTDSFSMHHAVPLLKCRSAGLKMFAGDVLHVPLEVTEGECVNEGHAFFFSSGASVFWGLSTEVRRKLLRTLVKFQERSTTITSIPTVKDGDTEGLPLPMKEFDHEFRYKIDAGLKEARFHNDEIFLRNFGNAEELLALSYGLAQSVKLLLYEEVIDSLVNRTRTLPDELAKDGKIKMSQWQLKRLIGELMVARYSVNLVSDILDTPEYFWQHAELERLHLECAREVELKQRARILDTRVQVIKDALDILNNEVSSSSSNRVERAILALIAVEVVIEVARLLPEVVRI